MAPLIQLSRRSFISASAAAAVLSARGPDLKGQAHRTPRGTTLLYKVYLAKPVPTWPCPDIDLCAEIDGIERTLAQIVAESGRDITLTGGRLLRTADDVPACREELSRADGVVAFNLTSGCSSMLSPIIDLGRPLVLFSRPYAGHDWSMVADTIKRGKRVDVLSSSHFGDLIPFFRIFDAMRRLGQTRVLCIRGGNPSSELAEAFESRYGVKVTFLDYSALSRLYESADNAAAGRLADSFIAGAVRMVEPSRAEVVNSMRLFLAVQKLLAEHGATAITIDCLGGFTRRDLAAYPCVAWTCLNDLGLVGVCEADLLSTLTQVFFQYLVNKPGFVSDPVIDTRTNTVIHAHCVAATRMDGPDNPPAPYIIRSHMEDNKGVSLQVKMRVGQEITLAKFLSPDILKVSTGTIVENPEGDRGCRTKVTTRVADADALLHSYTGGLHRVMFYGNHMADLKKAARLTGFRLEEEI